MADNPKQDALQTTELNYEELGSALIAQATEEQRKDAQDSAVSAVHAILQDILRQKRVIASAQQHIDLQERRIAALKAGKFKFEFLHNAIQFDDDSLNGGDL